MLLRPCDIREYVRMGTDECQLMLGGRRGVHVSNSSPIGDAANAAAAHHNLARKSVFKETEPVSLALKSSHGPCESFIDFGGYPQRIHQWSPRTVGFQALR